MRYLTLVIFMLSTSLACERDNRDTTDHEDSRIALLTNWTSGYGWLGVRVQTLTPRIARLLDGKVDRGALVDEVNEGSPAEKGGLQIDDVIVEFDGRPIDDADDLVKAVRRIKPGEAAKVSLWRKGSKKGLNVEVAEHPDHKKSRVHSFAFPGFSFSKQAVVSGMHLSTLNRQLAAFLDVPGGRGILVEEVDRNSEADKAGIKAGDVIVQADDSSVSDAEEFLEIIEETKEDASVTLKVSRKGAARSVTLKIDHPGKNHSKYYFRMPKWNHQNLPEIHIDDERIQKEVDRIRKRLDRESFIHESHPDRTTDNAVQT